MASIYVAGYTIGNIDGQTNNGVSGSEDAFISKYFSNGSKAWTKLLGTTESERAYALTSGSNGTVYVAGQTNGNLDGQTNTGFTNAFIAKYNDDGSKAWTKLLGNLGNSIARALTTGSDGSIYVSGESDGGGFIAKYNSDGSKAWNKLLGTDGVAYAVKTSSDGYIYVTGISFNDPEGLQLSSGWDVFVAKYSPDGTKIWTELLGSPFGHEARALALGNSGEIYIAGAGNPDATGVYAFLAAIDASKISSSTSYTLSGIENELTLTGSATVNGTGNVLNNKITGNSAANILSGMDGNDLLNGGAGSDTINGGTGLDTADFSDKSSSLNIALNAGRSTVTVDGETDTLISIENLKGGSGSDKLSGDSADNVLAGGSGNDILKGGAGSDTIEGGDGSDTADFSDKTTALTITLNSSSTSIRIGNETDTLVSIENLIGGSGNDTITGDASTNILNGGSGNDTLSGGGGDDQLIGGSGNDTYIISGYVSVQMVESSNQGTDTVQIDKNFSLASISNIENLTLTDSAIQGTGNDVNNTINGNTQDNRLDGGAGNDTLLGGDGSDILIGGSGNDTLDGGNGIDSIDYSDRSAGITVFLNRSTNATVAIGGKAEDTIRNIENITTGSGNDILIGDLNSNILNGGAGQDTIRGGLGNDTLDGGDGIDTLDYSDKAVGISVSLMDSGSSSTVIIGTESDVISNFENVTGGSGKDRLAGNSGANTLIGGLGDDILIGNGGTDILTGGSGADKFFLNSMNASESDRITDFGVGSDKIALDSVVFGAFGGRLSSANFKSLTTSQINSGKSLDSNDYLIFNNQTKTLYYDADGSGSSYGAVAIASLNINTLSFNDFMLAPVM